MAKNMSLFFFFFFFFKISCIHTITSALVCSPVFLDCQGLLDQFVVYYFGALEQDGPMLTSKFGINIGGGLYPTLVQEKEEVRLNWEQFKCPSHETMQILHIPEVDKEED